VQMDKLSPGALGYYDSIDSWEAAVQAVQEAQEAQTLLIEDMLLHPEEWVDKPCPGCFTLTELMVNVAISYILDSIPTYSGLLKDAGKAAASMAIMVAIADAINSAFPPGPGAPVIEYITPGYGNAVNDGASLSLFGGGFDYWAGNNVVIFIGPSVADSAVNAVDLAMSAMDAIKALQDWENVWELANALTDAFGALNDTLDFLSGDIPNLLKTGVVPLPVLKVSPFLDDQDFWQQIIDLPPLPEVNDSWLPKAGILIPISFSRGNGAAYKIVILP